MSARTLIAFPRLGAAATGGRMGHGWLAACLTLAGWHLASVHAGEEARHAFEDEANRTMAAIQERQALHENPCGAGARRSSS